MFSYQKLRKDQAEAEEKEDDLYNFKSRNWLSLRRPCSYSSRRWWRRPRLRIRGLRRLVGRRTRVVKSVARKVVNRFKEGRSHLGELFAGNYMFMQVNPSLHKITYMEKSFMAGQGGHPLPPPSSRYNLPWIA